MTTRPDIRPGEVAVDMPPPNDAALVFIGRIHTPWADRSETPKQGRRDGPICRIEIFDPWVPALKRLEEHRVAEVIYWLHLSRRDLVLQSPRQAETTSGTFALRSPVRPNPLGTSVVTLLGIEGRFVMVRGLDCVTGTPLLDLKPDRCGFTPLASEGDQVSPSPPPDLPPCGR